MTSFILAGDAVFFRLRNPRKKFQRKHAKEDEFKGDARVTEALRNGTVRVEYGSKIYTVPFENLRKLKSTQPTLKRIDQSKENPFDEGSEEPMPPSSSAKICNDKYSAE